VTKAAFAARSFLVIMLTPAVAAAGYTAYQFQKQPPPPPILRTQPTNGLRFGVYIPHHPWRVGQFEKVLGKRLHPSLAVRYIHYGSKFPINYIETMAYLHVAPVLEIEPGVDGWNPQQITDGTRGGDAWLRRFGKNIAALGEPAYISFEPEPNGWWHYKPWHENAQTFRIAYRHVHDVLSKVPGVTNLVTWLWQVSAIHVHTPDPLPWWPGAQYVNMIALDGYYYYQNDTFRKIFGKTITELRKLAPGVPMMIGETGIGPWWGLEKQNVADLFAGIRRNDLLGFIWFDARERLSGTYKFQSPQWYRQKKYRQKWYQHRSWRLQDHPAVLAAFIAALSKVGPLATYRSTGKLVQAG
jgi:mannan endo-1,4-beta-mannosidase